MRIDAREFHMAPGDLASRTIVATKWDATARAKNAFNGKHGNTVAGIKLHIPSATAQHAASTILNRAWVGRDREFTPGIGFAQLDGCVVKYTFNPKGGLLVPNGTRQSLYLPWVLVILDKNEDGHGWVVGYRIARDVIRGKYWRPDLDDPGWLCPQEDLLPWPEIAR